MSVFLYDCRTVFTSGNYARAINIELTGGRRQQQQQQTC